MTTRNAKCQERMLLAKEELEILWRNTKLNRYFDPISKLPPLGADPRPAFGKGAPHCCPAPPGTTRTGRLMAKWSSMPTFGRLPPELRDALDAAAFKGGASSVDSTDLEAGRSYESTRSFGGLARRRRNSSGLSSRPSSQAGSRHGIDGKEFPFIPCECCERESPIPKVPKLLLGEVSSRLVSAHLQDRRPSTAPAPAWPEMEVDGWSPGSKAKVRVADDSQEGI